ncbi:MAG TPA: HAMP domain-containing sensor histidine kinase [Myxococcales bacterium]|jgi:signal transduction histidine kinase|nr:HAMP domain-containing sensor histidine kinase [Myxococcales bacterium]
MEFSIALDKLRMSGSRRLAAIRLWGVLGFVAISATVSFLSGRGDWAVYLPLLIPYAVLSAACLVAIRRQVQSKLLRAAMPFADVILIYLLQAASLPLSPHPAGVAGFSLGLFVFIVLLSSLTMTPRLILIVTSLSWICEGALQLQGGVGIDAVVAAGLVLFLALGVTVWSARRIEELVERTVAEEVSLHVATQRSEKLEAANEALVAAQAELENKHTALLASQREAESLSRLLVHDLKGPLTTILCYTGLVQEELRKNPDLAVLVEDLNVADEAGQRMIDMIGDLLAIGRLEKQKMELEEAVIDVTGLLREVARGNEAGAKQKGVELKVTSVGVIHGRIDRELARRMLENLLGNAMRFLPRGGKLELAAAVEDSQLKLFVRNDGPTIPDAVRATLFERFGQGEQRRGHNAGLGLYFCKLAAEAHGGTISLEDGSGWNVSFVAGFPRAQATREAPGLRVA